MMPPAPETTMTATIIPLTGAENGETPAPLGSPLQPAFRASLTGAAARLWHRLRQFAETLGWLVIVASIIAAIR
jgi:hypothetical protein